MAEWVKFDGSEEQLKMMSESKNGWIWINNLGKTQKGVCSGTPFGTSVFNKIDSFLICEPNPHADMIIEWARTGRPVYQLMPNGEWRVVKRPWWNPLEGYSFDPPKFKLVYRVSLLNLKDEGFVTAISTHKWLADELEKKDYFVRWLTDWQEVEV